MSFNISEFSVDDRDDLFSDLQEYYGNPLPSEDDGDDVEVARYVYYNAATNAVYADDNEVVVDEFMAFCAGWNYARQSAYERARNPR